MLVLGLDLPQTVSLLTDFEGSTYTPVIQNKVISGQSLGVDLYSGSTCTPENTVCKTNSDNVLFGGCLIIIF